MDPDVVTAGMGWLDWYEVCPPVEAAEDPEGMGWLAWYEVCPVEPAEDPEGMGWLASCC